jgi:hypothetical protein
MYSSRVTDAERFYVKIPYQPEKDPTSFGGGTIQ